MGSKFNTLATIILWGSTKALAPPRGHNCILLCSPQKEMESSQLLKPDLSQRGCSGVSQFVAQLWQLFHNQGGNLTHASACRSETSRYFDAKEASSFLTMTLILLHPFMPIFNALLGLVGVWGLSVLSYSSWNPNNTYSIVWLPIYVSLFLPPFPSKATEDVKDPSKEPPHRHRNRIQWQKVAASSKSINTSHKIFALDLWNQRAVWFWVDSRASLTICWWYFGWVDKYCIRRQDPNNYSDTETRCLV